MSQHSFKHIQPVALRIATVLIILGMLFSWSGTGATALSSSAASNSYQALSKECLGNGSAITSNNAFTGKVNFVGSQAGNAIQQPAELSASASAEDAARGYLANCGSLFGLRDQAAELTLKRETAADNGRSVVRFQQTYQGIPVLGGEMIVHVNADKNIVAVTGEILPEISVETEAKVDAETVKQTALEAIAKLHQISADDLTTSEPEIWIYNPKLISPLSGATALVWRLEVTAKELAPIRELVLVDARRGNVTLNFNQVDTALNRLTYTARNTQTRPGTLVCNETNPLCVGGDKDARNAHIYAGSTYNFFKSYHGRDSINNAGMKLISTVHYSSGFCNAFWDGKQMTYGDGCFIVTDDVVAHELTHGVTEYESGLFYYYQSGAINESFSDVWGEFTDLTNKMGNDSAAVRWLMGEETSIGAIRNMKNPPAFGDPDKMTSANYYSGEGDSGGVHSNSGINNKAAYLITDGGTFNGESVTGLGINKTAKIYYEVQTNLLTSGADYNDLYNALYQACNNLVGTSGITLANCTEVRDATDATEMNLQPITGATNPEAPICDSGATPANVFIDSLEGGSANWSFAALTGPSRWGYDSPWGGYAHSGEHFLFADDTPATISDSYAAMKTGVLIPANAFLHFAHAYGYEDPNFDGGVLEYSADGGGTWTDAGSLFDYNGYNGTISSSSNPLNGRSGFIGDSHGYITSRLDLSTLAGQTIQFRWRMGLDSTTFDWGWWLDDVQIYTCAGAAPTTFITASQGKYDGYVLEKAETKNVGGLVNATAATFFVGDDALDRQYRGFLSFNTSGLPGNAIITSITLKVKKQSLAGSNLFTTHNALLLDIKQPFFGTSAGLQASDFQAAAQKAMGTFGAWPKSGWYSASLDSAAFQYINRIGTTQFRLRFQKDDNDDLAADRYAFYSGNAASAANRPTLVIEYYLP